MGKSGRSSAKQKKKEPKEKRDICFVVMPFGGYHERRYVQVFKPAIAKAGLQAVRADDLSASTMIVGDIWAYTKAAKVILADFTGRNPNVFYELGLAHGIAKPALLVAPAVEEVPFDLRHLRHVIYDKEKPNWGAELAAEVVKALQETLAEPKKSILPAFLGDSPPRPKATEVEKRLLALEQRMESMADLTPGMRMAEDLASQEAPPAHVSGYRFYNPLFHTNPVYRQMLGMALPQFQQVPVYEPVEQPEEQEDDESRDEG